MSVVVAMASEWTPMLKAVRAGDTDAVRRLLEAGEPAQPPGSSILTPMSVAACTGHVAVLELLLAAGADARSVLVSDSVPPRRGCLLGVAAANGRIEAVELLLRHGADPDGPGSEATPLMVAVRELVDNIPTKVALVRSLLRGGADPDLRSGHHGQMTPLMMAARLGFVETAEELSRGGAALDLGDENGWTALHWAACGGHLETARLLLRHGACLEIRNSAKWNAVDMAANHAHPLYSAPGPMVDLLLVAGAEPTLPELTPKGWELVYRSERRRREACEGLLREERAKVESFNRALPHIVACAAAAGSSNKRPRV